MSLDCVITQVELDREDFNAYRRITGYRFSLDNGINNYANKTDGSLVFDSLKEFRKAQLAVYEKAKEQVSENTATALASHTAAQYALQILSSQGGGENGLFENKKIQYDNFLTTSDQMLEIYQDSITGENQAQPLEKLTESFFRWILEESASFLDRNREVSSDSTKVSILGESHPILSPADSGYVDFEKKSDTKKSAPEKVVKKIVPVYISGHDHVKEEFKKIETIMDDPEYFLSMFNPKDIFKNYLLVGPPGTGKTTLVMTLAESTGLYFRKKACSELGSKYFSESSRNIHNEYLKAKRLIQKGEAKGVILFFDEFDQIAKKRGEHNPEADTLVTTLNDHMWGASSHPYIITIGATNCEEIIDPAITQRMETLYVGYPETDKELVAIHQKIIEQKEDESNQQMFGEIDFSTILPFSQKDERYKAGREIRKILTHASFDKAFRGYPKREYSPVTTDDLLAAYRNHSFEKQPSKEIQIGYRTVTATRTK